LTSRAVELILHVRCIGHDLWVFGYQWSYQCYHEERVFFMSFTC